MEVLLSVDLGSCKFFQWLGFLYYSCQFCAVRTAGDPWGARYEQVQGTAVEAGSLPNLNFREQVRVPIYTFRGG